MSGDALDNFEGPRTLRYFAVLLTIVVMLFALGAVLSEVYGFTLLESATEGFVENPMALLDLAGVAAFLVGAFLVIRFVMQHVE